MNADFLRKQRNNARPLQNSRFRGKRLAHQIAGETPDHNVLAQLGNFRIQELFDRLVGIYYERLFEQTDGAVKLIEFSIDNLLRDVFWFPFNLRLVNLALSFDEISRNICATDVKRVRRRDVQGNIFDESTEVFVPGRKIGL